MKVLVTGSSGFIGSHLVEALLKKGFQVYCLIRKDSNLEWIKDQNVNFIVADYLNKSTLYKPLTGMEYVFHLGAAINAPDWDSYYKINTLGTKNIIEVCAEVNPYIRKFIFVSSIAASGPSYLKIFKKETDECRPVSLYGKSKLYAEQIVSEFKDKIPIVIVRPTNILGIRQKELFSVLKLVKKRIIPMLGNRDIQTSICFVQDLVTALILVAENDQACGETYFVSDNKAYSWFEMLTCIAKILKVYPMVIRIPYPILLLIAWISENLSKVINSKPLISIEHVASARKHYYLYDSNKIQKELDFHPIINFADGINEIIDWYKKQRML